MSDLNERGGPVCVVCGEPATTVRNGHHFCSHPEHNQPEQAPPIVWCAIDGCGCAAVQRIGGRDLCMHHAPRMAA